jgi:hypothetical protein
MDTDYCWAHLKKVYGIKIVDSQFGKGLVATRNIPAGTLVAPLGGTPVRRNQSWEGAKSTTTAIYSYPFNMPNNTPKTPMTFHRRPGAPGFRADLEPEDHLASGLAGPTVDRHNWPQAQPTAEEQRMRVAAEVKVDLKRRRKYFRQYLVRESEYGAFQEEQLRRLARRLGQDVTPAFRAEHITDTTLSFSDRNQSLWNYAQFEAYVEFGQHKEIQLDATCVRRAGSYANDPSEVVPIPRGGGRMKVADSARAKAAANVKLTHDDLFPLAPHRTGWLVATRDIVAGEPIQFFYDRGYWTFVNSVKYGTKRVTAAFPHPRPAGRGRTLPVHVPEDERGIQRRPRNEPCKLK